MTGAPPTVKTRLLTIWPTSQPTAAAASSAVRVGCSKVTMSMARPSAAAASATFCADGCNGLCNITRS